MTLAVIDLRAERLNRGLSARKAAEQIGVSGNTLRKVEKDRRQPQARKAFLIAKFYGYQVTDIWPVEPLEDGAAAA